VGHRTTLQRPVQALLAGAGFLALGCAIAAGAQAAGASADWPQWRGPDRNGITDEPVWPAVWPAGGPKVLWRAQVGQGFSSVSVAAGRAYTMGWADGKDSVWCFDAADGRVLWQNSYPCAKGSYPGPRCTPTADSGAVYTTSREGLVISFGAADAKVRWSQNLFKMVGGKAPSYGYACSPLIVSDRLILETGVPDASIIALNKADGSLLWKSGTESCGYSSPVAYEVNGRPRVTALTGSALLGLDPQDGRIVWRYPRKSSSPNAVPSPVVFGSRMFLSSGYGGGSALLEVGEGGIMVLWASGDFQNLYSTSVHWGGYLYGFDGDRGRSGVLKCLDALTGKVEWAEKSLGKGQLIVAGGKLLILSDEGELVVAEPSPAAFHPLARAKVLSGPCWTTPAVARGRVYVRSQAGELVCLDVRGK